MNFFSKRLKDHKCQCQYAWLKNRDGLCSAKCKHKNVHLALWNGKETYSTGGYCCYWNRLCPTRKIRVSCVEVHKE